MRGIILWAWICTIHELTTSMWTDVSDYTGSYLISVYLFRHHNILFLFIVNNDTGNVTNIIAINPCSTSFDYKQSPIIFIVVPKFLWNYINPSVSKIDFNFTKFQFLGHYSTPLISPNTSSSLTSATVLSTSRRSLHLSGCLFFNQKI